MEELDQRIRELYSQGYSYRELKDQLGVSNTRITKNVKGQRTVKEALAISKSKGYGKLTEEGREILSEFGKKACKNNKKFWTKPEELFFYILKDMGYTVELPDYIQEILGIASDINGDYKYQYPFQRYVLDFVDLNRKIAICVNGDYWHANPLLYAEDKLSKIQKHNIHHDKARKVYLESKGWLIVDIWESEIYWNEALVREKIRATRKTVNPAVLHTVDTEFDSQVAHDWSEELKSIWFRTRIENGEIKTYQSKRKVLETSNIVCPVCGREFTIKMSKKSHKYCSQQCSTFSKRKVQHPTKEELAVLIEDNSWCAMGRMFGVSDNAVKKWARNYGLVV